MKEDAMPKRPWMVTTAICMLCLSIGLWAMVILSGWSEAVMRGLPLGPELGSLLTLALICYMTGRGRNWARIILLIIVLLGTPLSLLSIGITAFPAALGAHSAYIEIIQLSFQLAAVVLMFQRPSSHWFKSMKKLRSEDGSHVAI